MITTIVVLFVVTMLGGLLSTRIGFNGQSIRYPLIFAGSFLFSITIIHILPEMFTLGGDPMQVGIFVLIGFFLQQFLEYFTKGVEHGHVHSHLHVSASSRFSLFIALAIHSVLEGALLTHDSPFHDKHESHSLLVGILLHKIPEAFALMATLKGEKGFNASAWLILILYSLASPFGLLISSSILTLSQDNLIILFALVAGCFLHISTTIFVESSPGHHFGFKKIAISLSGALLAILAEYLF